jgi:hypothetical protein
MHNENIMSNIRQLCIELDIKLHQKFKYVYIHIQPLCECISKFFYIIGQHWYTLYTLLGCDRDGKPLKWSLSKFLDTV